MPYMEPHAIHLKAGDEITLQYLGAALVLQWQNLPEKTQQELVQQAELWVVSLQSLRCTIKSRRSSGGLKITTCPGQPACSAS